MRAPDRPLMQIHGHRGARGRRAENTLPALDYALRRGAAGVEIDICASRDDALVLHHDLHLNPAHTRGADGNWLAQKNPPAVRALTLAELRAYDVGAHKDAEQVQACDAKIPTLRECFAFMLRPENAHAVLNIELKSNWKLTGMQTSLCNCAQAKLLPATNHYAELLLAAIDAAHFPAPRILLQSFDWRLMRAAKQLRPEIKTAFTTDCASPARISLPQLVKQNGGDVWSGKHTHLRKELVREAHALGLEVCAWTVNDARTAERLGGWGVDVVTTDFPGEVGV